ncbi:MAG: signal peptidase I [Cyanobacteria bacterium P01_A01_bin.105]
MRSLLLSAGLLTASLYATAPLRALKAFYITSAAMAPTLQRNERILVDRQAYAKQPPQRGDIVFFYPPYNAVSPNAQNAPFVSRVVGLPGEKIEVKGGKVFIDGTALTENYTTHPPDYVLEATAIPEGQYFTLSDNRSSAYDSHAWGTVPEDHMIGKITWRYWPLNHWGTVN